jgi:uncharacterized protein YcnI
VRRRPFLALPVALTALLLAAAPVAAHTEWEPATAAPGSVITLSLFAEHERPDPTTQVELVFPQPITVVDLPAVAGWTATPTGGQVGGPVSGVTWTGSSADDLRLPITLGPLPDQAGRLQFKALQTYADGTVVRWIDDWPDGAPEPDSPGPVLDLVAGGPGTIPATTAPAAGAPTTTTTAAPATTAGGEAAAVGDDGDSGTSAAVPVAIAVVVALVAAGGGWLWLRSRRAGGRPGSGPGAGTDGGDDTPAEVSGR